ncbi:MAG: hypothetical protein JXA37_03835 [Chloroflexia bacterium]|nr:hypothetical protein [Chloroflexia bacterium]
MPTLQTFLQHSQTLLDRHPFPLSLHHRWQRLARQGQALAGADPSLQSDEGFALFVEAVALHLALLQRVDPARSARCVAKIEALLDEIEVEEAVGVA